MPADSVSGSRRFVAAFWIGSMTISWVLGAMLVGFNPVASAIWLVITLAGPLGVWAFVETTAKDAAPLAQAKDPAPRAQGNGPAPRPEANGPTPRSPQAATPSRRAKPAPNAERTRAPRRGDRDVTLRTRAAAD